MIPPTLRIGEASAKAGVNIQTLRYYERRGLIKEPERGSSGYREYTLETVKLVKMIKKAQKLGFSLSEIKSLLDLCERDGSCDGLHQVITDKIAFNSKQLKTLNDMQESLSKLLKACTSKVGVEDCPIMKHFNDT